jgi:acylphosphatase
MGLPAAAGPRNMPKEELVRWRLRALGRVQGVGYRERVRQAGRELGVAGEVWNEPDGSVSIEVQGSEVEVERFIVRISGARGVSDARTVERVTAVPLRIGEPRFSVRL